jgi:hypothetical protein
MQNAPEDIDSLSPQERELWEHVDRLWRLAAAKDAESIEALLHPDYVGWISGQDSPQNRAEAVRSAVADTGGVVAYVLTPLVIQLYEGKIGVVHYLYEATVSQAAAAEKRVKGRWTETYLKHADLWLLICVTGGPEEAS